MGPNFFGPPPLEGSEFFMSPPQIHQPPPPPPLLKNDHSLRGLPSEVHGVVIRYLLLRHFRQLVMGMM